MWLNQISEENCSVIAIHESFETVASFVAKEAKETAKIVLYDKDLEKQQVINCKDLEITSLKWHSSKNFLLICWLDGSIGLVDCDTPEKLIREDSVHKAAITRAEWSLNGKVVLTGDALGSAVVFYY